MSKEDRVSPKGSECVGGWVRANSRRILDLEMNAFSLEDFEEVVLITIPKRRSRNQS